MSNDRALLHALGFVWAPLTIALLWVDLNQAHQWLMVFLFFIFLPLVRLIFPEDLSEIEEEKIPGWLKTLMYWLPSISALIWLGTAVVLPFVFDFSGQSLMEGALMWVSVWLAASLTVPACHELIHRMASPLERLIGRITAASIGLICFTEEHAVHHVKSGKGRDPDCPEQVESVYVYSLRSGLAALHAAWDYEVAQQVRRARSAWTNRIVWTSMVPVLIGAIWVRQQGFSGLLFFILLLLGTNFTMRAITFIQHWGLQEVPLRTGGHGVSWVSSCVFQSWMTYNIAYHEHHHLHPGRLYWRLRSQPTELTLPLTYPLAFLAALVPPLYRRLMAPRLAVWVENASRGQETRLPGRCFISSNRVL
jgi:fatty acid desaturase